MNKFNRFRELLLDKKAQGDFGAVYMIIIFAIVALLLILVVKPMFRDSQDIIKKAPVS